MKDLKNRKFGLKDVLIFSLCSLLAGVLAGFFLAPVKKGMRIGCNYISKEEADRDFHEDLEMEMNELR